MSLIFHEISSFVSHAYAIKRSDPIKDFVQEYYFRIPYTLLLFNTIALTPYMVLPLFATRFADYAGGIRVSFIQPRLF